MHSSVCRTAFERRLPALCQIVITVRRNRESADCPGIKGDDGVDYDDVSEFVQGRHEIFPALEREVAGMRPGEEKKVKLQPEQGFWSAR